jgi:hypothetical protein
LAWTTSFDELAREVAKTKEGEEGLRFAIDTLEELQDELDTERAKRLSTSKEDPDWDDIREASLRRISSIEETLANKNLYIRCALDDDETRLDKCMETVREALENARVRAGVSRTQEPASRPSPPRMPSDRPFRGSTGSSKMPPVTGPAS